MVQPSGRGKSPKGFSSRGVRRLANPSLPGVGRDDGIAQGAGLFWTCGIIETFRGGT